MNRKINDNQSPHWLDQLKVQIAAWQKKNKSSTLHVNDMKTPSGRVHTGALRGVLLHDLIAKVLQKTKLKAPVVNTYVFNDMDPMDGLPAYLDKSEYEQYMGKPMFKIPAPSMNKSGVDFSHASEAEKQEFKQTKSFAEFYALDFIKAFRYLGCEQKIVWSHKLYESGQMDETISFVLDNVKKIKEIYEKVASYQLPENWYPFQVICPKCGKVGTTLTTDWDGKEVIFECQENKVDWAKGCGFKGKISPFRGTGKLLWKVDWPAHWRVMGVNIEGAGKDHTSAGGSRDMANAMIGQVFKFLVPFNIPYEWILIRGAKMSSSKGVGTSAREFVELFPPEVGRFLFVSRNYNSVIDFDPSTMSIPDLFDQYDQAARIFWQTEKGDQRLARSFELAQINQTPDSYFLPRFRDLVLWMQDPKINLEEKFVEIKGSVLNEIEKEELAKRQQYAKVWLDRYAPKEFKLRVTDELPKEVFDFDQAQKEFLQKLDQLIDSQDWQAEDLQQAIFELAKNSIGARQAFQTIYLGFLGKKSGPKAAWLLMDMEQKVRKDRIDRIISANS